MFDLCPLGLNSEVALVTGAASGIGRAIAVGVAAAGVAVTLVDLPHSDLESVEAAVTALGARGLAVEADVTVSGDMERAVAEAERTLGPLTMAVNSAGIADASPAEDLTPEQFERLFTINVC